MLTIYLNYELTLNSYTAIYDRPLSHEQLQGYSWWGMCRLEKTKDFDRLLLSVIDEALSSLGEPVKQSTYFHIENKFCVARNKIPESLQDFQVGLEKIFGAGAQFIEILIMKNLHSRIGLPLRMDIKQFEFLKYVYAAKESFLRKEP